MGFFDLNIPYKDSPSSNDKANRIKTATKAMELGYIGIAYNRTMKGIMSDHDRCSIPLLSLSSLLKFAPSLSSSVELHRNLLGFARASPFRQYTRLTVCAETVSQAQVLSSRNPVSKTYDLVAVKPLNQSAFDHACENSEVDIIAIDLSEKLPFRLKLPMVKAAIERGVYFEIAYSNFIKDVQVRRQMISNAKLLVEWTRGRNLIISSACASVNELRGPYDVANLVSLFGISMEHAKASVSKNCRDLIANAFRKRKFYKEAVRVEPMPLSERSDSEAQWSVDSLKWDPISSGDGDLLLDDLSKSFSVSNNLAKTVKAINFDSIIDCASSHRFLVKDLISGSGAASGTSNAKNLVSNSEKADLSDKINNAATASGSPGALNVPGMDNFLSVITPSEHTKTMHNTFAEAVPLGENDAVKDDQDEFIPLAISNQTVLNDLESRKSAPADGFRMAPLQEDIVHETQREDKELLPMHGGDTSIAHLMESHVTVVSSVLISEEPKHPELSMLLTSMESRDSKSHVESLDPHDAVTDRDKVSMVSIPQERMMETEQNMDPGDIPGLTADERISEDNLRVIGNSSPLKDTLIKEVAVEDRDRKKSSLLAEGTSALEYDDVVKVNNDSLLVNKQMQVVIMEDQGLRNEAVLLNDAMVANRNDAATKVSDGSLTREHDLMVEVTLEDQKQDAKIFSPNVNQCISESREKQRKPSRTFALPFKRLLSPTFKKKAQRRRRFKL